MAKSQAASNPAAMNPVACFSMNRSSLPTQRWLQQKYWFDHNALRGYGTPHPVFSQVLLLEQIALFVSDHQAFLMLTELHWPVFYEHFEFRFVTLRAKLDWEAFHVEHLHYRAHIYDIMERERLTWPGEHRDHEDWQEHQNAMAFEAWQHYGWDDSD